MAALCKEQLAHSRSISRLFNVDKSVRGRNNHTRNVVHSSWGSKQALSLFKLCIQTYKDQRVVCMTQSLSGDSFMSDISQKLFQEICCPPKFWFLELVKTFQTFASEVQQRKVESLFGRVLYTRLCNMPNDYASLTHAGRVSIFSK